MNWKYTNIQHAERMELGLSLMEYCIFDAIYQHQVYPETSKDGWSNLSYREISSFFGISMGSISNIIKKGIELDLIEMNDANNKLKRTTEKWYKKIYKNTCSNIEQNNDQENKERSKNERKRSNIEQKRSKNERHIRNNNSNNSNNNTVEKTSFSDNVCAIVEFLNDQTGSKYRPTTKKTRDCIKARMNEGFVLDEFKTVIRHKTKEWLGKDGEQWLRPETLFGNKFEGYLNDAIRKQSKARKEVNGAIVDENGNIKLKTTKQHVSNAELEKERAHMARLRELQRQVYGV